jgi:CBS-domain-containing membrane protein
MLTVLDRLAHLRVADVMRRDVVTVPARSTMSEAAAILARYEISGAPVIDDKEHCVGVITATDFVRREADWAAAGAAAPSDDFRLNRRGGDAPYCINYERNDLVADRMSPAVQAIRADATLIAAAREMCGAHLHRLIVLDEHARVAGVLTTLDVVAALVNAVEEQWGPGRPR